jgi:hypothetical protein
MSQRNGQITQDQMDRLRDAAEGDSDDCFGQYVSVKRDDLAEALYEIRMWRRLATRKERAGHG